MSGGAEHYIEAERWAEIAKQFAYGDRENPPLAQALATLALAHATIGLTAATAHAAIGNDLASTIDVDALADQAHEWLAVIADPPVGDGA